MSSASGGTWLLPSALAMGSLTAPLFNSVPPGWLLCTVSAIGLLALLLAPVRWLGAGLLACCWALWNFQARLDDRLVPELSGQVLAVTGVVSSIPQADDDRLSFRFEPQQRAEDRQTAVRLPHTILVRWYEEYPPLAAGQHWSLEVLLKPPWGAVNFQGADREKWLFASGIGAVATVRSGLLLSPPGFSDRQLTSLRAAIFTEIGQRLPDAREAAVIQALAVGDRSGMQPGVRQLLALTGTSHLLAISGLHIGLAAAGGMLLARGLGWFLPIAALGRGYHLCSLLGGALAAGLYAALAGFGIPTVRALLMLLAAMTAISFSRQIHPARAWLLALAAVVLIDPFASLRAGFWFSFMAVAALLLTFVPRNDRRSWWRSLLLAQAAVTLALLPVSAAWFQAVSLVSFAANLVAIPLVSLTIVPLVLAGVVAGAAHGQLAGLLWSLAGDLSGVLLTLLELFARLQGEMTPVAASSPAAIVLALLGAGLLLLPRGLPVRWCGLFLLCPLFLPPTSRTAADGMELEILDVGQGTAVLLRAAGKTLLYDSGPGDGAGRDRVSTVIVPALNRAPDRVIISHGDQDHAGGLWSLQARYPQAPILANLNLTQHQPGLGACHAPFRWRWGETEFEVLHPSAALPYRGNDSSCVVEVRRPGGRILLSGDISAVVEARLLLEGLQQSDVLVVPHHGSLTSSSPAFIATLQPRVAVATASLGNRFGFPREEVRRRYDRAGVLFWSTGECGALHLQLGDDGQLTVASARLERPAIWRWPAGRRCPAKGAL